MSYLMVKIKIKLEHYGWYFWRDQSISKTGKVDFAATNSEERDNLPALKTLIAYVDTALVGYLDQLDVWRLASHILGKWSCCSVMDNVSCIQGSAQALVIIHWPCVSTYSLSKEWGGVVMSVCVRALEHISLPALQPVLCSFKSYMGREGQGHLVYKYTRSIGCCATWCNVLIPSSCHPLATFKPLKPLNESYMEPHEDDLSDYMAELHHYDI